MSIKVEHSTRVNCDNKLLFFRSFLAHRRCDRRGKSDNPSSRPTPAATLVVLRRLWREREPDVLSSWFLRTQGRDPALVLPLEKG